MHRVVQLPPFDSRPIARAAAAYMKLGQELQTLSRQRAQLDAELQQATRADRAAYAAALRAGKNEPAKRAVTKVADRLEQIDRRREALDLALDDSFAEVVEVASAHRGEWVASAAADTATRRQAATDAVMAAGVALAAYSNAMAAENYARDGFPERAAPTGPGDIYIKGLPAQNGEPRRASEVVAAVLEALARTPREVTPAAPAGQPDFLVERVA